MKKFTIAITLLAAGFSAIGDDGTYEYPQPNTSRVTRAEVSAATLVAMTRGEVAAGELSYVAPVTGAPLTRMEVRQALARARANNELVYGELSYVAGSSGSLPIASVRSSQGSVESRLN